MNILNNPWARLLTLGAIAAIYTLSPIDLLPDLIPLIGIIDDIIVDITLGAVIIEGFR